MMTKAIVRVGLLFFCAILLCGCTTPAASPTPSATAPEPTVPAIPGERLPFAARYYRTGWSEEGAKHSAVATIQSPQEAQAYYDANKDIYRLDRKVAPGFADTLLGLDDAYFRDYVVIVLPLVEPSGSIRHEVTAVVQTDDRTRVLIQRKVPELQTADMAQWLVLVEIGREGYAGNKADVQIYE